MKATVLASFICFLASTVHAGLVCYEYKYAPNLVRAVQSLLKSKALYSGAVDGQWGPKTKKGVHQFQIREHIPIPVYERALDDPAGELNDQTLRAMFGKDAPTGVSQVRNPHRAPEDDWASVCR